MFIMKRKIEMEREQNRPFISSPGRIIIPKMFPSLLAFPFGCSHVVAVEWGRGREAIGAVLRWDLLSPQVGREEPVLLSSFTLSDHHRHFDFCSLCLIPDGLSCRGLKWWRWAFGVS